MKYLKRLIILVITSFNAIAAVAQDAKPEMADVMRSNGKIYIVVAVCLTILVGLFLYVFMIDRKISAYERSVKGD